MAKWEGETRSPALPLRSYNGNAGDLEPEVVASCAHAFSSPSLYPIVMPFEDVVSGHWLLVCSSGTMIRTVLSWRFNRYVDVDLTYLTQYRLD